MGYLGTLNFNSLYRTEHKHYGDYFSSYAQMYAQAKPCEISTPVVLSVKKRATDAYASVAHRISSLSGVIRDLASFIGGHLYNKDYFDEKDRFIGEIRVYMFESSETLFFLCAHDIEMLDKAGFTSEDCVLHSDTVSKYPFLSPEKTTALKCRSWRIVKSSFTDPINTVNNGENKKAQELFNKLLTTKSRADILSVIIELNVYLAKLISLYFDRFKEISDVSVKLDKCLEMLDRGEKLYAQVIDHTVEIKDENGFPVFKEKPSSLYYYSFLFKNAGTDGYGSEIVIDNADDMEFFISLFPTRKNRDLDLENAIIQEYEYCKNHNIPIEMKLGGSY